MNIPLNIDWHQILLHLFNFAILAGGLYLLLYKPVKDFMDKRVEYYRQQDEAAAAKMSEAEEMKASYESRFSNAQTEIDAMKNEILQKAETAADEHLKEAKKKAEKLVDDAHKQTQAERAKVLAEAQQEIAQLAAAAAQKVLISQESVYGQFLVAAEDGDSDEG